MWCDTFCEIPEFLRPNWNVRNWDRIFEPEKSSFEASDPNILYQKRIETFFFDASRLDCRYPCEDRCFWKVLILNQKSYWCFQKKYYQDCLATWSHLNPFFNDVLSVLSACLYLDRNFQHVNSRNHHSKFARNLGRTKSVIKCKRWSTFNAGRLSSVASRFKLENQLERLPDWSTQL